jgi:hypothetical protein
MVPGMTVLGSSRILVVSKFSSAILADLDMRGAVSIWLGSVLRLLGMIHFVIHRLQLLDDPNYQADNQ